MNSNEMNFNKVAKSAFADGAATLLALGILNYEQRKRNYEVQEDSAVLEAHTAQAVAAEQKLVGEEEAKVIYTQAQGELASGVTMIAGTAATTGAAKGLSKVNSANVHSAEIKQQQTKVDNLNKWEAKFDAAKADNNVQLQQREAVANPDAANAEQKSAAQQSSRELRAIDKAATDPDNVDGVDTKLQVASTLDSENTSRIRQDIASDKKSAETRIGDLQSQGTNHQMQLLLMLIQALSQAIKGAQDIQAVTPKQDAAKAQADQTMADLALKTVQRIVESMTSINNDLARANSTNMDLLNGMARAALVA